MDLSSETGITIHTSGLTSIAAFWRHHVPTDSSSIFIYIKHTQPIVFFFIRSDEGLTIETSALETLYGGQTTSSTQLIKPRYTAEEQQGMFFKLTY